MKGRGIRMVVNRRRKGLELLKAANLTLTAWGKLSEKDKLRVPGIGQRLRFELDLLIREEICHVVITTQPALVEYLRELGMADNWTRVIQRVTPDDIRDLRVVGTLPLSLAAIADRVTEIPIIGPPELRGRRLTIAQIKLYACAPLTYRVRQIEPMRLP